eukprot:4898741-Prymnesium_polylepis.1
MSGREVFKGNHERMGAHVIGNTKLAQPPPARAGPSLQVSMEVERLWKIDETEETFNTEVLVATRWLCPANDVEHAKAEGMDALDVQYEPECASLCSILKTRSRSTSPRSGLSRRSRTARCGSRACMVHGVRERTLRPARLSRTAPSRSCSTMSRASRCGILWCRAGSSVDALSQTGATHLLILHSTRRCAPETL